MYNQAITLRAVLWAFLAGFGIFGWPARDVLGLCTPDPAADNATVTCSVSDADGFTSAAQNLTVRVIDGATIAGDVTLGSGDDTVITQEDGNITGAVDGGAGNDALQIERTSPSQDGEFNFWAYTNFESFTKTGTGIAKVTRLRPVSSVTISGGALIVSKTDLTKSVVQINGGNLTLVESTANNISGGPNSDSLSFMGGTLQGGANLSGGDDIVEIQEGSKFGTLDGGADNDILKFVGPQGPVGARDATTISNFEEILVQGGAGARLYGTASVGLVNVEADSALVGEGLLITGNVVNRGSVTAGGNGATLTIAGDYTQHPGSTLFSVIRENGLNGLLAIDGTASLDGTIEVFVFLSPFTDFIVGQTYTVLTATNGITGNFTNVTQPTTKFFEAAVAVGANSVTVTIQRSSFNLPFFDTRRRAIARRLDALASQSVQGEAKEFIDALTFTERSQAGPIIDQLESKAASDIAIPVVEGRHAFLGELAGKASLMAGTVQTKGQWVTSVSGFGQFGSGGSADFSTGGVIALAGYGVSNNLVTGIAMAGTTSSLSITEQPGDNDHNAFDVAAFAAYRKSDLVLTGIAGISYDQVETERSVFTAGDRRGVNGDIDGIGYSASLDARYLLSFAGLSLVPETGVRFAAFRQGGYSEEGLGNLGLNVEGDTLYSARLHAGSSVKTSFETSTGLVITPSLGVFYERELADRQRELTVSFIADPSGRFSLLGESVDKSRARIVGGIAAQLSRTLSADLRYEGAFGQVHQTHRFVGSFRLNW